MMLKLFVLFLLMSVLHCDHDRQDFEFVANTLLLHTETHTLLNISELLSRENIKAESI